MLPNFDELIAHENAQLPAPVTLGQSRDGRPVNAYCLAGTRRGARRISLIAGCHADEPVGPRLLDTLVRYLAAQPDDALARANYHWWIVPHINPDGAERNHAWSDGVTDEFDFATYLRTVVRELPGDDIEFGFPRDDTDAGARPEPTAVYNWWRQEHTPFALHVSFHGMAVAAGPWYLIDSDWVDRCEVIKTRCRDATARLGYKLHDIERNGEKGFHRIERGFCTRPNSRAMANFFHARDDVATAQKFRPSSMETVRALGGDPLTLVPEIPLFVLPGVGVTIVPTDPVADEWRDRIARWRSELSDSAAVDRVRREADAAGVRAVPIRDQMTLQWELVLAGIAQTGQTG